MARSYVFTIAQHFWDLVRRVNRYGDTAARYLTPAQVVDLNNITASYSANWGPSSATYVQFRQQA